MCLSTQHQILLFKATLSKSKDCLQELLLPGSAVFAQLEITPQDQVVPAYLAVCLFVNCEDLHQPPCLGYVYSWCWVDNRHLRTRVFLLEKN